MVAEQASERGVYPIKSARPSTGYKDVPSGCFRLAALAAAAGFLDDFLRFPIVEPSSLSSTILVLGHAPLARDLDARG